MTHQPPPNFRSIAIYCHNKPAKEEKEAIFLRDLLRFLYRSNVREIHGDLRTTSILGGILPLINDSRSYDLSIGIGGDGTLLKMIRTIGKSKGLILGINFGTLGFLSELQPDNALSSLEKIWQGHFQIDERMILRSLVYRPNEQNKKHLAWDAHALNEIAFGHGGMARLTNFTVHANRRFLATYRSDGLIFSTPTGSTAYSMSAGGPIVSPTIKAVLITPVSPHTLTHRPILLPSDKSIGLKFSARTESVTMTIDGQIHFNLKSSDEIRIQAAHNTARFIRLPHANYFRTLRNKMGWASDNSS